MRRRPIVAPLVCLDEPELRTRDPRSGVVFLYPPEQVIFLPSARGPVGGTSTRPTCGRPRSVRAPPYGRSRWVRPSPLNIVLRDNPAELLKPSLRRIV